MRPLIMIGIGVGLGLSMFLLYNRKKQWNSEMFRWCTTGIPFVLGLIGLLQMGVKADKDAGILYLGFMAPLPYNCMDRLFKRLSQKYQNRDFYLYLSNSSEISPGMNSNPHITGLDMIYSFSLVIIIMLLVLIPALLMKGEVLHH